MSASPAPPTGDFLGEPWRRPRFRPQCTHITMLRLYGPGLTCDLCQRPGEFGWIYRCSQDREDVIEFALSQGYPSTFDVLGDHLVSRLGVRKRSRAARQSSLSFFDEITSQQMHNYCPEQVANILKQRENVRTVIAAEEHRQKLFLAERRFDFAARPLYRPPGADIWTEMLEAECEHQVCGQCRPGAADRAFLSLNAVANNEIMPCAATGYGFHAIGGRPIADARVVRSIGHHDSAEFTKDISPDSRSALREQFLDLLHGQIYSVQSYNEIEEDSDPELCDTVLSQPPAELPTPRLKHSPRYENLSIFNEGTDSFDQDPTRHPWTPPPSPGIVGTESPTDDLDEEPTPLEDEEVSDALTRKQMILDLDRMYELLGSQHFVLSEPPISQEGIAIFEESAECGTPDLIQQV